MAKEGQSAHKYHQSLKQTPKEIHDLTLMSNSAKPTPNLNLTIRHNRLEILLLPKESLQHRTFILSFMHNCKPIIQIITYIKE